MKFSDSQLPSNRKFGFFFTLVFGLVAFYFYANTLTSWFYFMTFVSAVFLLVSILRADMLLPLNKLWMRFGFLLGAIVGPIVLGVIFFGIFTPIALLMRLFRRDELRLKLNNKISHWKWRSSPIQSDSFKYQF